MKPSHGFSSLGQYRRMSPRSPGLREAAPRQTASPDALGPDDVGRDPRRGDTVLTQRVPRHLGNRARLAHRAGVLRARHSDGRPGVDASGRQRLAPELLADEPPKRHPGLIQPESPQDRHVVAAGLAVAVARRKSPARSVIPFGVSRSMNDGSSEAQIGIACGSSIAGLVECKQLERSPRRTTGAQRGCS
jgi:hypothetical protein